MGNIDNFYDFVKEEYGKYGGDHAELLIKAYIEYAKGDNHHLFDEHIREHHNNAFGKEDWQDHVNAKVIAKKLSGEAVEVLWQIVGSPKFDGDVVSKSGKSELYHQGLVLRICNNRYHGDNAANLLGWLVYCELKNNGRYDGYQEK